MPLLKRATQPPAAPTQIRCTITAWRTTAASTLAARATVAPGSCRSVKRITLLRPTGRSAAVLPHKRHHSLLFDRHQGARAKGLTGLAHISSPPVDAGVGVLAARRQSAMPSGGSSYEPTASNPDPHACRSVWSRDRRAPASPARPGDPRPPRGDASRTCGGGCAA